MYSSARSVLYLSTMKPHDPKDEDDEEDEWDSLFSAVVLDVGDGKPRSLGSRVITVGCALIVFIVLIVGGLMGLL